MIEEQENYNENFSDEFTDEHYGILPMNAIA